MRTLTWRTGIAFGAAFLALCCGAAHANLLTNGSFEIGAPINGCVAGTTSLPGWSVTTGNIDILASPSCALGAAADGVAFIDLTGSYGAGAGTISQSFATTAGASYTLSFYFGANPDWQYPSMVGGGYANDGPTKSLDVLIDGAQLGSTYSIDTTGQAWSDPAWHLETTSFVAAGSTTQLTFESLNGANGTVYGPLLDGVSVVASVPEPGTVTLLLGGLLVLGLKAARRRVA